MNGHLSNKGGCMLLASAATGRRLNEIGAILGGLGALVIFIGMVTGLASDRSQGPSPGGRRRDRFFIAIGSLLTGAGFLLLLFAVRVK